MKKYSVLLIGCGGQGCLADAPGTGNEHKVISFAHALKEREDVFDIILYDENCKKMLDAYGIWRPERTESKGYADIIIIATPDDTHYEELKYVLKSKPKLVICEKPLCSTSEQADEIVKLYDDAGIPILVNYTRRFIPELIKLKGIKELKDCYGVCTFNRGWLHTATHAIDFFNMIGIPEEKQYCKEVVDDERVWDLTLHDNNDTWWNETRIGNEPVQSYYDYHMRYVIDNAYNYLEGKEELKCTMYDGLKSLEIMERLMQ